MAHPNENQRNDQTRTGQGTSQERDNQQKGTDNRRSTDTPTDPNRKDQRSSDTNKRDASGRNL